MKDFNFGQGGIETVSKIELQIPSSPRQQRKIVRAFGIMLLGSNPDHALAVSDIEVTDDEHKKIISALAGGAIGNKEIDQLLGRIRSENLDPVFIESLRDPAKTVDISAVGNAFAQLRERVVENQILVGFIKFVNKKEHARALERHERIDRKIVSERKSNIVGEYVSFTDEDLQALGHTGLENDFDLDIYINRHPNPYTIIRIGWINEYLTNISGTEETAQVLFDGLRMLYGKKLEYANNVVELKKQSDIKHPEFMFFRKNKLPGIQSIIRHTQDKISEDIKNGKSYADAYKEARKRYLICREMLYESLYEIYRSRCASLHIEPWNEPGLKMVKHEKIWNDILHATPRDQINHLIKTADPDHNTKDAQERFEEELRDFEAKIDAWARTTMP